MSSSFQSQRVSWIPLQLSDQLTTTQLTEIFRSINPIDKLSNKQQPDDVSRGQLSPNVTSEPWRGKFLNFQLRVESSNDAGNTVQPCPHRSMPPSKHCRDVSSSGRSCSSDTVQPVTTEQPKRSLNITDDSDLAIQTKAKPILTETEQYVTTARPRKNNLNESTSTYDDPGCSKRLKPFRGYKYTNRSMMKHPAEDERFPVAREKDPSNLMEFRQFHRADVTGGANNPNDETSETTLVLSVEGESTISRTSRHEEDKLAVKTQTTQATQTLVINANNTVNDDDDVACGKSSKQSGHLVLISNKIDVQSLESAETKSIRIKNKPNISKNIPNESGVSSAVNLQQLNGSYHLCDSEVRSDRVKYPTKPIIFKSVIISSDKTKKSSADNEVGKNSDKTVIIQKNNADIPAREPNSIDYFNKLFAARPCQLHKDYVAIGTKCARLEKEVERLKAKDLEQQNKSTAQREDTIIKEHDITNSKRNRANNKETKISRHPMKMRNITAGLQKVEPSIEANARSSPKRKKKTNTCLSQKLAKAENARVKLQQKNTELNKKIAEQDRIIAAQRESWEMVLKKINKMVP